MSDQLIRAAEDLKSAAEEVISLSQRGNGVDELVAKVLARLDLDAVADVVERKASELEDKLDDVEGMLNQVDPEIIDKTMAFVTAAPSPEALTQTVDQVDNLDVRVRELMTTRLRSLVGEFVDRDMLQAIVDERLERIEGRVDEVVSQVDGIDPDRIRVLHQFIDDAPDAGNLERAVDQMLDGPPIRQEIRDLERQVEKVEKEVDEIDMGAWRDLEPEDVGRAIEFADKAPPARDLDEMMQTRGEVYEMYEEVKIMFEDFRKEVAPVMAFIAQLKSLFVKEGP